MKEIEFRGKRVEKPIKIEHYAPDGWVYGDLITCDDGNFILPHDISGEMYIDRPYKFRANDVEARVMLAKVGENTIGQYTGLKDKNGTKIFEGDIVVWENIDDFDKIHKSSAFQIKFDDKHFYSYVASRDFGEGCVLRFSFNDIRNNNIEVIGNIYDNPELLKVEE